MLLPETTPSHIIQDRSPFPFPKGSAACLYGLSLFILIGLVLLTAGCADRKLENAFEGDYSSAKNNKIINEYCQSCHIHKNLEPRKHMTAVRNLYKRPFFRRATQCRNCHYLEKNWVHNTYGRKTRSPKEANRGRYRDIEKAQGKRKK